MPLNTLTVACWLTWKNRVMTLECSARLEPVIFQLYMFWKRNYNLSQDHMLPSKFSAENFITARHYQPSVFKMLPIDLKAAASGVKHIQRASMNRVNIEPFWTGNISQQKHLCVSTNTSVCMSLQSLTDWITIFPGRPNNHHISQDLCDLTRCADSNWNRSQAKRGRGFGEQHIYLHKSCMHALKYHQFCSQCFCSTTHN